MRVSNFFFYDLETSGLSARTDRIMQFAGQRTDLQLRPVGQPVNLLVRLADDTLPSPGAIMVTKITPQSTQQDGLTEAEFCRYAMEEIFTPGTCAVGYNSVRFDDEFMRYTFWRNFYDPYEWQWKDGRSRWDLLDVVRLTRALRPEGINWPVTPDGKPTNRLELITKENGITHAHAHDALSDVEALIAVTRLVRQRQPKLYDFLFELRDKRKVQQLVNLENKQPFVYASGRYSNEHNKVTIAFPLAPGRNGNVLVYDLRYNLDELLAQAESGEAQAGSEKAQEVSGKAQAGLGKAQAVSDKAQAKSASPGRSPFFPIVKELCYNKCPAVAPISVLSVDDGWEKVGITEEQLERNLNCLLAHPEFAEQMRSQLENRPEFPPAVDAESALYDGFLNDRDRVNCEVVRNADADRLATFHPEFLDERLPELLLHYKARNYANSLSDDEQKRWEEYRLARLQRQAPKFLAELQELQQLAAAEQPWRGGAVPDSYTVEELLLWYQSLFPTDY